MDLRVRRVITATDSEVHAYGRALEQFLGHLFRRQDPAHAVIPLVSAMNAVSRLISSSLNIVSLWPA